MSLTFEQVIKAARPAWSDDLVYRFIPREGFQRASMVRFAPAWIRIPLPRRDVVWYHEDSCDCEYCQPLEADELLRPAA
jgi:hypothetical protein